LALHDTRSEVGAKALESLIRQQPGQYPRGPISYLIEGDLKRQRFDYALSFPGERVEEEGQVELNPYKLGHMQAVFYLKRGDESIVEVSDGRYVLHLSEREGIAIKVRTRNQGNWTVDDWTSIQTWYPDLTNRAQPFRHPEGRGFKWEV
jgi:hypothetical protein